MSVAWECDICGKLASQQPTSEGKAKLPEEMFQLSTYTLDKNEGYFHAVRVWDMCHDCYWKTVGFIKTTQKENGKEEVSF